MNGLRREGSGGGGQFCAPPNDIRRSVERAIEVGPVALMEKSGGRTDWRRHEQ
mgnify:CR=1 FL=1